MGRQDRRRLKTAVAVFVDNTDTKETRKERRRRIQALRSRIDTAVPEDTRANLPINPTTPLGPGVRTGEYFNPIELNQPANQGSSVSVAGIFPFQADSGSGHRGPLIGIDLVNDNLWHYSPWDAYQAENGQEAFSTNILVIGAYRAGKSGTIKLLVFRSLAFGYQAIVPSDSKGEWGALAHAAVVNGRQGQVIRLGGASDQRVNPLDRGPRSTSANDEQDEMLVMLRRRSVLASIVAATLKGQHPLTPQEHSTLTWALDRSIEETHDRPSMRNVHAHLTWLADTGHTSPKLIKLAAATERTLPVLERFVAGDLQGLFEDESTVAIDADAPIVVVDTSALFDRSEEAGTIAQICTSAWTQAVISDRNAKRRRYIIREEGWRDMAELSALQNYQQWLKLSRHYGIANVLILHKMADFDAVGPEGSAERSLAYSIAGDIENKFVFRQNTQEYDNLTTKLKIPPTQVRQIMRLGRGCFKAFVGTKTYDIDAFATSTEWETELFSTDEAVNDAAVAGDEFATTPADYELDELLPIPAGQEA